MAGSVKEKNLDCSVFMCCDTELGSGRMACGPSLGGILKLMLKSYGQ